MAATFANTRMAAPSPPSTAHAESGAIGAAPSSLVYLPDENSVWRPVKILSQEGDNRFIVCNCDDDGSPSGDQAEVVLTKEDLALVQNVIGRGGGKKTSQASMPLVNLGKVGKVDNLVDLNFLHEPAILFALRKRFASQQPYTYTGNIVVAVNPYAWIEGLYEKDLGFKYLDVALEPDKQNVGLKPHVYFISSYAFADMVRSAKSQSILVSGESGAGKTETTKIVITHLVSSAHRMSQSDKLKGVDLTLDSGSPAARVLGSNHLLEAFGNAKTVRNDNSSRFGKYTSLQFDSGSHEILGCKAKVYLLEKSRVVTQSSDERNYHIFYQLLRGATDTTLKLCGLWQSETSSTDTTDVGTRATPDAFPYLAHGCHVVKGVDDAKQFSKTLEGLRCIGVMEDITENMLASIAAVLHIGCLPIISDGDDSSTVKGGHTTEEGKSQAEDPSLIWCAKLLGISTKGLIDALCSRIVIAPGETYQVPCKLSDAILRREAMAKDLYSRIFLWLVNTINLFIAFKGDKGKRQDCSISILDIFGFESFQHNSFEQLCINYANEKLQQRFTKDVFTSVQDEYKAEGIDWVEISYEDNTDCLKMFEGRLGLLAILEEETARGSTDEKFSNKLAKILSDNTYYHKPRLVRCGFHIRHYAGTVSYDANTFLTKNADALAPDIVMLLKNSSMPFIADMYDESKFSNLSEAQQPATKKKRSRRGSSIFMKTVTSGFKSSLSDLMREIGKTNVGYIRCIKPNALKSPTEFDNTLVCDQLRYCGVVEAVAISRAAFPNRMSFHDLVERFYVLGEPLISARIRSSDSHQYTSDEIRKIMNSDTVGTHAGEGKDSYVVGRTQVFFALGVLEKMEALRDCALATAAVRIQTAFRRFSARITYLKSRAAILIQREARRRQALIKYQAFQSAALMAQKLWRCKLCARSYRQSLSSILAIQCASRVWNARSYFNMLRHRRSAVLIQTVWRKKQALSKYNMLLHGVICLQAEIRRNIAFRNVEDIRKAAAEEAKLESKILALQLKLAEQAERHAAELAEQQTAMKQAATFNSDESKRLKEAEASSKDEAEALQSMNSVVDQLRKENAALKHENKVLKEKFHQLDVQFRSLEAKMQNQTSASTAVKRQRPNRQNKSNVARRLLSSEGDKLSTPEPMTVKKRFAAESASSEGSWGSPSALKSSNGATPNKSARRRSWIQRMFSAKSIGINTPTSPDVASFPIENVTPTSVAKESLRGQCGRFWKVINHNEWKSMSQPFYCHMRIITGGMVGLNHKRLAYRMFPSNGWRQNYVFIATPLQLDGRKLVALRYSLSQTHLSAQSFFMGWQKKLGAHTDNSDRCTPSEWFEMSPVQGEDTVFAAKHYESGCFLNVGTDSSIGFAGENANISVEKAVEARTSGREEVALFQIEILEPKAEFDVIFNSQNLGLRVSRTVPLLVRSFTRTQVSPGSKSEPLSENEGVPGEAERLGSICIGDAIIAVSGIDVRTMDRRSILDMISEAERPLSVRFRTCLADDDPSLMGSPNREDFEKLVDGF